MRHAGYEYITDKGVNYAGQQVRERRQFWRDGWVTAAPTKHEAERGAVGFVLMSDGYRCRKAVNTGNYCQWPRKEG